jgi:hypothetical protein
VFHSVLATECQRQAYDYPLPWQIAHGYFWVVDTRDDDVGFQVGMHLLRIPLTHVTGEESINGIVLTPGGGGRRAPKPGSSADVILPGSVYGYYGLHDLLRFYHHELHKRLDKPGVVKAERRPPVYYDFVPVEKNRVLLFVLCRSRGVIQVLGTTEVLKNREDRPFRPPGPLPPIPRADEYRPPPWADLETLPVPFDETFYCHVSAKGTYFFVTASGQVYAAPQAPEGQVRVVKAVWTDPGQPVRVMLTDGDRGTAYVFCEGSPAIINGRGFYLELTEELPRQEFTWIAIKSVRAPEPLKTLLEYAQGLAKSQTDKE